MAISTETQELINYYNQKKTLSNTQLSQVSTLQTGYVITTGIGVSDKVTIYGPQENIDNVSIPIQKLDTKILEYNNQIQNLQQQILIIKQQASSVGCGTYFPLEIVYRDRLGYVGYGFTPPNPYFSISGTIISSNVGVGTYTFAENEDIGTSNSNLNICYNPLAGCTSGECVDYVTSINNLQSQVTSLEALRDPLIEKVNILKKSRIEFELQKYAYNQSTNKLNQQVQEITNIVNFLEDPANDEFL